MEMHTGMTAHVVLLARIGKEVGLGAGLDTGIEERETMLRYDRIVIVTRDDLKFALQVLGLADEAALGIAFRIILWCAHIALAVHHLVPFPVDNRASGNTYLKDIPSVKLLGIMLCLPVQNCNGRFRYR